MNNMTHHNEYALEEINNSPTRIKVLKIVGHMEFNENTIAKKFSTAIREILTTNTDIDYLIAYYYPTQNDREKNAALCSLDLLKEDLKQFPETTLPDLSQRIRWNDDYGMLSDDGNKKTVSNERLVNDTYTLLQTAQDARYLVYELETTATANGVFSNELYQRLETWIFKAKHAKKRHSEVEGIVQNDLIDLTRHLSNILYCCVSDIGKKISKENDRQWILKYELINAKDKYEVIYHQLLYILRKNLVRNNF